MAEFSAGLILCSCLLAFLFSGPAGKLIGPDFLPIALTLHFGREQQNGCEKNPLNLCEVVPLEIRLSGFISFWPKRLREKK